MSEDTKIKVYAALILIGLLAFAIAANVAWVYLVARIARSAWGTP